MGAVGPLLLLFIGFVVVGLCCSAAAFVVRLRAAPELTKGERQGRIDASLTLLAISAVSPILAGTLSHFGFYTTGLEVALGGLFLLWPVSAFFAIIGRGVGRRILLVGDGVIALSTAAVLLTILIWSH